MSAPYSKLRHYDPYISSTALPFCAHRQGELCNWAGWDKATILGRKAVFSLEAWKEEMPCLQNKKDNKKREKKTSSSGKIGNHLCTGGIEEDNYFQVVIVTGGTIEYTCIHSFSSAYSVVGHGGSRWISPLFSIGILKSSQARQEYVIPPLCFRSAQGLLPIGHAWPYFYRNFAACSSSI